MKTDSMEKEAFELGLNKGGGNVYEEMKESHHWFPTGGSSLPKTWEENWGSFIQCVRYFARCWRDHVSMWGAYCLT